MLPTDDEKTVKELNALRHAQKVAGQLLDNRIPEDESGVYADQRSAVQSGKEARRVAKAAKKAARRAGKKAA